VEVWRCRVAELQRCRGTVEMMQRCRGAEMQRWIVGAEVQRCG